MTTVRRRELHVRQPEDGGARQHVLLLAWPERTSSRSRAACRAITRRSPTQWTARSATTADVISIESAGLPEWEPRPWP